MWGRVALTRFPIAPRVDIYISFAHTILCYYVNAIQYIPTQAILLSVVLPLNSLENQLMT